MSTHVLRRFAALGASAALAVGGLTAFAPTASAASGELDYACQISFFNETLTVVVDTDLPDTVVAGSSTPYSVTATVVVPDGGPGSVLDTLRNLAATVDGSTTVKSTLNDVEQADATLAIPATPAGTSGPLTITAQGSAGAFAPTAAGTHTIKAGSFTGTLNLTQADGTPALIPSADLNCTPEAGQDLTVDTVEVTEAPGKAKSVTKVKKAKYAKKKKRVNVTAQVRSAGKPAKGKVKVTLKKGKKTVKVIKGKKLNKKGIAKVNFKKITKKGKYKVIVQYQGNKTTKKSKKSRIIRVK